MAKAPKFEKPTRFGASSSRRPPDLSTIRPQIGGTVVARYDGHDILIDVMSMSGDSERYEGRVRQLGDGTEAVGDLRYGDAVSFSLADVWWIDPPH